MSDTQEPAKAPTPPPPSPPPAPPAPPPPPSPPPAAPVNQSAKAAAPPVDGPQKAPQQPPPPPPTGQAELEARVPHQQAVEEGIKAAASIQQTTQETVEAEAARTPVKAPAPHPHVAKMTGLMDRVSDLAKRHKEEVLDLRNELQNLLFDVPADMPGRSLSSVRAIGTQIEEGINMLDPDCSARSPG